MRKLNVARMVLLGKTHTVQFAYGTAGLNHDHGTPHNPWHEVPHAPGGSSSAVAVASGLVPFANHEVTGSARSHGALPFAWLPEAVNPSLGRGMQKARPVISLMGLDAPSLDATACMRSPDDGQQQCRNAAGTFDRIGTSEVLAISRTPVGKGMLICASGKSWRADGDLVFSLSVRW